MQRVHRSIQPLVLLLLPALFLWSTGPRSALADAAEELRVKRQSVFEFTRKPVITRDGDAFTIAFTSKAFCDATIAVEDARGRIVRHLASGVLGGNAPAPFKKNALEQAVVWDGKDDQGRYIDPRDGLSIRVSLGLKPRFERTLFWSAHKQRSGLPSMAASADGVLVFDARGVDHMRLFDHGGEYVRTVYPFPAGKVKNVAGLQWHDFPQGYRLPLKQSAYQQTLLTSGDNDSIHNRGGMTGRAAVGIAVRGKRIALAFEHLNRLAIDGTSGGLPLKGPATGFEIMKRGYGAYGRGKQAIGPTSIAFSPDGKTLYLSGYLWRQRQGHSGCYHVVHKLDFESGTEMTVFAGNRKKDGFGKDNAHFAVPTSVACDAAGNVYVSDFLNDRVQIFAADGRHLKSIKTPKPTKVLVHQKSGEIFVVSWEPIGIPADAWRAYNFEKGEIEPTLTQFGAYPKCAKVSSVAFPLGAAGHSRVFQMGQLHEVELDSWAPGQTPVFWIASRKFIATRADHRILYYDHSKIMAEKKWAAGIRVITRRAGKWITLASFGDRVTKSVKRARPIAHNIQHLYVNPTNGKLYVGEADSGATVKAFKRLVEINPRTGRIKFIDLPFNALDAAFDLNGLIYLRTTDVVARFDPRTWKEIPWDYGAELPKVTSGMSGRTTAVKSGLIMPAVSPVCFHQGGMSVSAKGNLAVACSNRVKGREVHHDFTVFGREATYGKPYAPRVYPGREESSTSCSVHIWDRHGNLVYEDAVWGLPQVDGVHIDRDDNVYVMATPTRILDGKRYFNFMSETVVKFAPNKAKILHSSRGKIPLNDETKPKRKPDLSRGGVIWADGAEWFYGGVGYAGFNNPYAGGGCACWFSRFTLDYFARSIAPEPNQYRVAVLDSAGNLILRIGGYGNIDDGTPLIADGGPADTRPMGGDEVSLFHACFVGTHTDRRIFIADLGNARIVSVKLDYHATETIALKDIAAKGE